MRGPCEPTKRIFVPTMVSVRVTKGIHGVNELAILKGSTQHFVIFFPGDRIAEPHASPEFAHLQDPLNICNILAEKFGPHKSTVVVISPTRFEEASFAVYDTFLPKLTSTGEPLGYNGHGFRASEQLQSLLEQANLCPMPTPSSKAVAATTAALPSVVDLIGFSKGGIVINQLLAELAAYLSFTTPDADGSNTSPPPRSAPLLRSLRHFHYLDAGLNCAGAYLNDPEVFSQMATWCTTSSGGGSGSENLIKLILHGSPRQWEDSRRPFIKAEKDRMVDLCQHYGVPVQVVPYFKGQKPSLKMHFEILKKMVVP